MIVPLMQKTYLIMAGIEADDTMKSSSYNKKI